MSLPNCSSLPQYAAPTCWDDDKSCVCLGVGCLGPCALCDQCDCCTPDVPIPPTPKAELVAWKIIYDSLNGDEWTSCSGSDKDPCSCAGYVGCNTTTGQLVSVNLDSIGINGVLRGEALHSLTALQSLSIALDSGALSGTLPTQIGSLPELRFFSITGSAAISGTLPRQYGKLLSVGVLSVGQEDGDDYPAWPLSGTLPTELATVGSLASQTTPPTFLKVTLGTNRISGTLSPQMFRGWGQSGLQNSFRLNGVPSDEGDLDWGSPISGSLPTQIGLLSLLGDFELQNQRCLSGTIPTQISRMQGMVGGLELSALPKVSGSLPTEIGRMSSMQQWVIGGVAVSGE